VAKNYIDDRIDVKINLMISCANYNLYSKMKNDMDNLVESLYD
jgi:Holliday junction resolvase RusA-like endonuclease